MLPVLFSINNVSITTMTAVSYLAFFCGLFVIWRISKFYEMDSERILDLFLITSVLSLFAARIYYILYRLPIFDDFGKMVNIFRFPGYSFWGGFLVAPLVLWLLCRQFKIKFWQIVDIAVVGAMIGISITSFGCLFGGCQYGQESNLFLAVDQIGVIGKRFPLQVIEGFLFLMLFLFLRKRIYHYHIEGIIAAYGLMIFSLIKLVLEYFRGDLQKLPNVQVSLGTIFAVIILIWGIFVYYRVSKKTVFDDLRFIFKLLTNGRKRKMVVSNISKNWYNFSVNFKLKYFKSRKEILKLLHVKTNPTEFQ